MIIYINNNDVGIKALPAPIITPVITIVLVSGIRYEDDVLSTETAKVDETMQLNGLKTLRQVHLLNPYTTEAVITMFV